MRKLFVILILCFVFVGMHAQKPELKIPTTSVAWLKDFAFTADGKFLVTVAMDMSIKIYDRKSSREVHTFFGHQNTPYSIAIAKDNRTVVSGGAGGEIIIWDLYSGSIYHRISGENLNRISTIAIADDAKSFICGSIGGDVSEYNLTTGELISFQPYWSFWVRTLGYVEDGNSFFVVAPDDSLEDDEINFSWIQSHTEEDIHNLNWSSATMKSCLLPNHARELYSITTNPSEFRISPIKDRTVGDPIKFPLPGYEPIELAMLSSNEILILCENIATTNFAFLIFDLKAGKISKTAESDLCTCILDDCADGLRLRVMPAQSSKVQFISGCTSVVYNFNLETKQFEDIIPDHKDFNGIHLQKQNLLLAGSDKKLKKWDLSNNVITEQADLGRPQFSIFPHKNNFLLHSKRRLTYWDNAFRNAHDSIVVSDDQILRFSKDSTEVAIFDSGKIDIYSLANAKRSRTITPEKGGSGFDVMAWYDNKTLAYINYFDSQRRHMLYLLDGKNTTKVAIDSTQFFITDIVFPSREKAVIATHGSLALMEVKTGKIVKTVTPSQTISRCLVLVYAPRINQLIASFEDGQIFFLNPETLEIEKHLTGHRGWVHEVKFTSDYRQVISSGFDNTIRFWDYESGINLVTLSLRNGKDWVVVHENGLFDASAQAMKDIYYVVNDSTDTDEPWKIIELEQLKHRYYQPDLLQIQLGYKKEELRTPGALETVPLAPKVSLTNEAGMMKVRLKNQGGGIGKVVVFVEDAEVLADVRPDGKHNADQTFLDIAVDLTKFANRFKSHGPTKIKVVAWNKDEWISTQPQYLDYYSIVSKGNVATQVADAKTEAPRLFGLVVGISDYTGNSIDLHYAAKDAADYSAALKLSAANLFGKENVSVELYSTEFDDPAKRPSRKNILTALAGLATKIKPSDVVIVYLSGHGVNYGGAEGDFYYLTQEASGADAAYLADESVRNTSAISSMELTDWLNKLTAGKKIMILDACASGKAAEKMYAAKDVPASQIRALDRMQDRTGFYILAGSAADAVSYESSVYGQGLLTYSLLKAMKGSALRVDGGEEYVDVHHLFQFAVDQVPELSKNIGGIQKPFFKSPDNLQSFDIGKVDTETKQAIKISEPKPVFIEATFSDSDALFDELELTDKFNAFLQNSAAEGKGADFAFMRVKEYPGAYRITGSYTSDQDFIYLKFRIISDKKLVGNIREIRFSKKLAIEENIPNVMAEVNKMIR